jgi:HD-GYP domain-containing protein (c-di-GMP phosphodiesterase class II)
MRLRLKSHSCNVEILSVKIGKKIGLSEIQLTELSLAALFHDIGKYILPDSILNKPEGLTDEEWRLMRYHPYVGGKYLLTKGYNDNIANAVICHHERFDGKGYTAGLKEEQIPLYSRIIAVADSYDAMISERPYSEPRTFIKAIREIITCAGTQFDPKVVDAFLKVFDI